MYIHNTPKRNKTLTQKANASIRQFRGLKGSKVTSIKLSNDLQTTIRTTQYGYRKYTTGEYVPKKYIMKFGWKNTYYQHAKVEIKVGLVDQLLLGLTHFEQLCISD